jgi:hypothetical protein
VEPLPPSARHPADYRDELEHAEVARVLSELPDDHPACITYRTGAREASDSLSLSHLLAERMDLVQRLVDAYMGHTRRIRARSSGAGDVARGLVNAR